MEEYRQGVIAVIVNDSGQVMLFERSDHPGAWQFPQGGIEEGESSIEALYRELYEEIGCKDCKILKSVEKATRYKWPSPGKKGRVGQEHTWFLTRLKSGTLPKLEKSDGSFRQWQWVTPQEALQRIVDWKRPAAELGLRLLGIYP